MASPKPSLTTLPSDILFLLPQHLATIEDFKELSSTCRRLRSICHSVSPNLILRLAAASSRVFFRPDPYFLVAATAKQVGQWAMLNENNANRLRTSLRDGIEALFGLCLDNAGLTMEDIRRLHASRFTAINPAIDLIDRCAGYQWRRVPDFWSGGCSDAATIDCEPERALFQIAIYGSLFHATLEANLEGRPGLDREMRLDYITYCIPDWFLLDLEDIPDEATGPYRNGWSTPGSEMDQRSIRHVFRSKTWRNAWRTARQVYGPDFEDVERQMIWRGALLMQGLEGFEILRPESAGKWKPYFLELREKIEKIDTAALGSGELDEYPILEDDIRYCGHRM
ncbi:MAG: hypothetical protein Q9168_004658 [Polycauliona sp. 1 TL-2023]